MSSFRRLWYRGLWLRDRRRLELLTNAGSRGLNNISLTSLIPTTIKSSQLYSTSSQTHTHQSRSLTSSPSNHNSPDFIAWSQIPSSLHPDLNQFAADNDKDGFISYLQAFGPNYSDDEAEDSWIYASQSQLYFTSSQTHTHQSRSFTSSPSNDNSPDFIAWSQIPSSLHPALKQFAADNDKDGFISYLQAFGPSDMNAALDQNAAQRQSQDFSMVEVFKNETGKTATGGIQDFVQELESLHFEHDFDEHTLCIYGNKSREKFVREYFMRANEMDHASNTKGMRPSCIIAGGTGTGKSILARAALSKLAQYFPDLLYIYISLKHIKNNIEFELDDIFKKFNPENQKVFIVIDWIQNAYHRDAKWGPAFTNSVSRFIERGVSINMIGTAVISPYFLRGSHHSPSFIEYYTKHYSTYTMELRTPIGSERRLEVLSPLDPWYAPESFASLVAGMIFDGSIESEQLLKIPVFEPVLRSLYWITGGNPFNLQQIINGKQETVINKSISKCVDTFISDDNFKTIATKIIERQTIPVPPIYDEKAVLNYNPFEVVPVSLYAFPHGDVQNAAFILHEMQMIIIDEDRMLRFNHPIFAAVVSQMINESKNVQKKESREVIISEAKKAFGGYLRAINNGFTKGLETMTETVVTLGIGPGIEMVKNALSVKK